MKKPAPSKTQSKDQVVVLDVSGNANPGPRPYTYFASNLGIQMVSDKPLFRAKYPD